MDPSFRVQGVSAGSDSEYIHEEFLLVVKPAFCKRLLQGALGGRPVSSRQAAPV